MLPRQEEHGGDASVAGLHARALAPVGGAVRAVRLADAHHRRERAERAAARVPQQNLAVAPARRDQVRLALPRRDRLDRAEVAPAEREALRRLRVPQPPRLVAAAADELAVAGEPRDVEDGVAVRVPPRAQRVRARVSRAELEERDGALLVRHRKPARARRGAPKLEGERQGGLALGADDVKVDHLAVREALRQDRSAARTCVRARRRAGGGRARGARQGAGDFGPEGGRAWHGAGNAELRLRAPERPSSRAMIVRASEVPPAWACIFVR